MSEWDAAPPPTPQDYPAVPQSPSAAAAGAIAEIARQTREAASGLFTQAGITIASALMTISRGLRVEGDFTSTGSATLGGDTDVTGAMTVGGTLVVTGDATFEGDLDVPNGSIGNDKLASPLVIRSAVPATASGWAVGTSMAAMAASSIPVPDGFTRATVTAWANMHFMDSSPNGGWVRARIAGDGGAEMGGLANLQLGQSASHTRDLTSLPAGSSIGVSCDVRASVATAGMSGRIAQITAVAFFQR